LYQDTEDDLYLKKTTGFYTKPKTIEEIVDHTVGKCLDQFDIDHNLYERWGTSNT